MASSDARTTAPAPVGGVDGVGATVGNAALWRGVDQAHLMGLELIVATVLWGGLGMLVDRWLGTGAWFTVLGALVGNAAGLYLVYLRAQRMEQQEARAVAPGSGGQHGVR